MFPYIVCEFAEGTMSNLVKECFGEDFPDIIKKRQVAYIFNYLSDLGAETILLESEYVDRDYLEDYSRYYVKCFNRYGERCARLHFFSEKIVHSEFDEIYSNKIGDSVEKVKNSYLGFIVIKPIPKTYIGKTCLKTYSSFKDNNDKKVLQKSYTVNLFGIRLEVDSIAFQEQDKVLSACATTSIWCALHALNWRNASDVPSCSEITISAINHIDNSTNSFPNEGLTNKQILRGLDSEELRHYLMKINDFRPSFDESDNEIVKIYIDSRVPLIMSVVVFENESGSLKRIDGHAITVLGYKDEKKLKSLYIHDDRIGPFARANIKKISEVFTDLKAGDWEDKWCLEIQDKDKNGWKSPSQILVPEALIAPTHKKVRIAANMIINTCKVIVDEYKVLVRSMELESDHPTGGSLENEVSYSVSLEQLADVKKKIHGMETVLNRREVLTKSTARFIWVAKFSIQGTNAFDILFDATDIPQGNAVLNTVVYSKVHYEAVISPLLQFKNTPMPFNLHAGKSENFIKSFISHIRGKDDGHDDYLNKKFGELRAPKTLTAKELEIQKQDKIKKYYGSEKKTINCDFGNINTPLIWAISHDGALLIGEDGEDYGHPTLTGFKPARISGDLWLEDGQWHINAKSGRYSSNYSSDESGQYLVNAKAKFLEVYSLQDTVEIVAFVEPAE